MSLVRSFLDLLQPFVVVMTTLTFQTFSWPVSGSLFAPRRTITGMILAAGVAEYKHRSAFHRDFSAARWSRDRAGLALFDLLSVWLEGMGFLAVDDTLALCSLAWRRAILLTRMVPA